MGRLTDATRLRVLKELEAGVPPKELSVKYDISPSAVSYLKKVAVGETPALTELEGRLSVYHIKRLVSLAKNRVPVRELAEDAECSSSLMKSLLRKNGFKL